MPDNLTLQFKEELKKRGIAATDSQVENFLKSKRQLPKQPAVNINGSLYENVNSGLPSWYTGDAARPDDTGMIAGGFSRNLYEGLGVAAWEYADIALFTAPSALLGLAGIDPIEEYKKFAGVDELSSFGKIGAVAGESIGFLKPMKWVSRGTNAIASRVLPQGGKKIVGNVIDDTTEYATEKGLQSGLFKKSLKRELKSEDSAKLLNHYTLSPQAIEQSKAQLKSNIARAMSDIFPGQEAVLINDIADKVVLNLGKNGRHINTVGQWIQRVLGRTLSLEESSRVSKYLTMATELTVNFSLFNTMVNGVQAMAGNEEFDPKAQFWHALKFSIFLPIVESIPGGGRVPIWQTAKAIRKHITKYKNTNYDNMSEGALNGILRVIANNKFMNTTNYGTIAAKNVNRGNKNIPADEARELLKEIRNVANVDGVWREFASEAGKDLVKSLGRMTVGALYFNAETLRDEQYLKGIDPETLGAHLIVGGIFTKMRKPIFDKKLPTITDFQSKVELLNKLGMDISAAESWNSYYSNRELFAGVNSGSITEPRLKLVYDILYNESNEKMVNSDKTKRLGSDIKDPEYNLLRFAKDVTDIRKVSESVVNSEPEKTMPIENLSRERALELIERLKKVEINTETKETLTENNFDKFYNDLQKTFLESGSNTIVDALVASANKLGLQVEGGRERFDLDKQTIRIEDIAGDVGRHLGQNHEAIVAYQNLLYKLKAWGYIGTIRPVTPKLAKDLPKMEDIDRINSQIEGLMKGMTDELIANNFPKSASVEVLPNENAWLTLLGRYRNTKDMIDMYSTIKNENIDLYESLNNVFSEKVPAGGNIGESVIISKKKPENMDQSKWEEIRVNTLPTLQNELQLLASIWSKEKKSPNKKRLEIPYEEARQLVSLFKNNNPSIFSEGFLDRFTSYYTSREHKDLNLGVREVGIIDLSKDFLIASKDEHTDRLVFPWGEEVRAALRNQGIISEGEINSLYEKYNKIRESLSRIDNKYISFQDNWTPKIHERGDLAGFIESAFELTGTRQRDLLKEYDRVHEKVNERADIINHANAIIERLFDTEANSMRQVSKEESLSIIEEINKIFPSGELKEKELKIKDKVLEQYFNTLKSVLEKWINASDATAEFSLSESMYEGSQNILSERAKSLNTLRDTMQRLQNLGSSSLYRMRSAGRVKHELTASFVRKLKDFELDITNESSLDEIFDKHNFDPGKKGKDNKLHIDNFIEMVDFKIIAEQKNFSNEQYNAMNEEISRNRNILSDNNPHVDKLTYQSIERDYSNFNPENLNKDEISHYKRELDASIAQYEKFKDQPENLNVARSSFKNNATDLLREVHKAIEKKNSDDPVKAESEKISFNEKFPGLMATHFGGENVKTISLSENGIIKGENKAELFIENKFESDGAFSQFQKKILKDIGISIYKIGKTSVFGGRTYEDFADILSNQKHEWFDTPRSVVDKADGSVHAGFSGTRVTVSYVDQMYIRTDNIINNPEISKRFKNSFNEWYDSIRSELDRHQIRNFEKLFKKWRESETLGNDASITKEIIKNMYWHHLSPEGYKDLVAAADNRAVLNETAVSLLKYFNTMSTSGAKVRGSSEFLRVIKDIAEREIAAGRSWWGERPDINQNKWDQIPGAIDSYLERGHWRVKSISDESTKGFTAKDIVRDSLLKKASEALKEEADGKLVDTVTSKRYEELIVRLDRGDFPSLESSSINAQTWIGTNAAHLMYLQKGRTITDNLAGIKPVGWSQIKDILLKTNFIYDRNIAILLDRAGIDILTTESAAKRFGPGHIDLKIKEGEYKSYAEAFESRRQELTDGPVGELRMEDLYLGKTNERKVANVSYGLLDFIDKAGFSAFTGPTGNNYYKRLESELGDILKIRNRADIGRNETFYNTARILHENGEIFNDATSGSLHRLIGAGVDVQSVLTMRGAERMMVRRVLGEMTKTKSEHGSYSILVPYLEGSVPLYSKFEVDGKMVNKQMVFGGKKLSAFDGDIKVRDYDKVKFIFEYKDTVGDSWDFQVSTRTRKGKIEIISNDPITGKISKQMNSAVESFIKELRTRADRLYNGTSNVTYKNIYDVLENMGEKNLGNLGKIRGKLHSLSLRIPNLAGDIAIHKIEGFFDRGMGNVTGVNPFDLAVIHQADFDVDAIFNHHDMPKDVINSVTKNLAKTPDVYAYESDSMDNLDIFNTGPTLDTVGKGKSRDSLESHYENFRNSQRVFGSVMNLAPALTALKRLEFSVKDGKMMDIESDLFTPNKQRMKNTLQHIIDATKRSNVVSRASSEDIVKFILFGRKFPGSDTITEKSNEYREQSDYIEGESKWDGIFDLRKWEGDGYKKEIMEDIIVESINIINTQNRMLTGVNDAAGRRAPDFNQMMYIKNRLEGFLDSSTRNRKIFNNLLFKYRVADKSRKGGYVNDLIDIFYNISQETYSDRKLLLEELFKKGKKAPIIHADIKNIVNIRQEPADYKEGEMNMHLTGVGGIIAERFGTKLNDPSKRLTSAAAVDTKFAQDFIDKFETANMILSEQSLIDASEFQRNVDKVGSGEMFGSYGDLLFKDLSTATPNSKMIEKYSIMYHVLQRRESSLRRFINSNRGIKYKSDSVARAQYRLNLIGAAKDYLEKREVELIDSIRPSDVDTQLKNYFFFKDYDLRRRPSGYVHRNPTNQYQYVYRVNEKNARVKYKFVASVEPLRGRFLRKGSEYVVLKNPIRTELMSSIEMQDAYALLRVTGEALAENIEGMNPNMVDSFYERLGSLKRDFYELSNETVKINNKSKAFAQRNWMDAKEKEDNLIREFFHGKDGKPGVLEQGASNDALFTAASIVIKPTPTAGLAKLKAGSDYIMFPTFKINRRLVLAVERYLDSRSNQKGVNDVYNSIFSQYGHFYRRAVNRIAHPSEEAMYVSDMYASGSLYKDARDPLLDFVYDKPGFLYIPSVLQKVQKSLRKYGGRSFRTIDQHGNIRTVIKYDEFGPGLETVSEYYSKEKNYEDTINSKVVCE